MVSARFSHLPLAGLEEGGIEELLELGARERRRTDRVGKEAEEERDA